MRLKNITMEEKALQVKYFFDFTFFETILLSSIHNVYKATIFGVKKKDDPPHFNVTWRKKQEKKTSRIHGILETLC